MKKTKSKKVNVRKQLKIKLENTLTRYKKTHGFLTEYSKSIPSEDMAEIFSFLMTDKELIEDKINSDKILSNKVNFIKLNLAKIDKNIL